MFLHCLKMKHTLALLLILGTNVMTQNPCPYNVKECRCSARTLLCTNLTGIPPLESTNQNGSITNLTFQSSNLNNITENSLPANLQTLVFSNVSITSISPNAFSNSSTTLTSFTMDQVSYDELPDALLNVSGLTTLQLSNMNITGWPTDVLQYLGKTVRSVSLTNAGLTSWPQWLKDFTLVNSIDVSSNKLKTLPADAFKNVKSLKTLLLSSTFLDDTGNLDFALAPVSNSLETLNISHNFFTQIPAGLVNMPRLSTLQISFNLILEITPDTIPLSLTRLDLTDNLITELTNTSFPPSSALKTLLLTFLQFTYLSDWAFQPLRNLTGLSLAYTNLETIPLALTKLPNLQILDLSMGGINLRCNCPVDGQLARWYQSLRNLTVVGWCRNDFNTINVSTYLQNGKQLCSSGFDYLRGNLFLCLLVVMATAVYFW
ncbi:unnamed protein product [Candidula unifasciata]|uniref:Uncharacterized protein n=1 Tax=Candidula unifasciata TaxID=100452 RepID=A0A8S3ZIN0_9EUPU|nr:unnamed protein product [Candidula unifasciata]